MAFLPSAAKAPFSRSPGRVASSAWRVSIWSASTATSASTASTASATGAAPSRTIARVVASADSSAPSRPRTLATGSTLPRRLARPSSPLGACGTRATAGRRMTSATWLAGRA